MMNTNITRTGLIFLLVSSVSFADDIIVGPVGDVDCDYNTIQEAVDSGGSNMLIFVSNQLTTNDGVFIHNKPVLGLYGGYANCTDASTGTLNPGYTFTTISKPAGLALTLFETRAGFSNEIDVNGFKLINSNQGLSVGNGASTVEFIVNVTNVDIYNNNQGVFVSPGTKDVTVINYNNGEIYNNTAGGVYCVNATVNFGDVVAIRDNNSTRGGGVFGRFCDFTLESGDNKAINDTVFGIFKNTATENGGGVYLDRSNFTATGNSIALASVSFNTAPLNNSFNSIGLGGGFFIGSGSLVNLNHVRVYGNTAAQRGGGIYMEYTNFTVLPPILTMKRSNSHCTVRNSNECSILSYNKTTENDGQGGAIYLNIDTQANIFQTEINNNESNQASAFYVEEGSILTLEGGLIINNKMEDTSVSSSFSSLIYSGSFTNTIINFTTIADNMTDSLFRLNTLNTFILNNSILSHDSEIFKTFGEDDYSNVDVDCSLYTNNPDTFHSNFFNATTFFNNNPQFNSAVDYGLTATSPAIDSNCSNSLPANYTDIVGLDRTVNGLADLGAYERPAENLIFNNDFEN